MIQAARSREWIQAAGEVFRSAYRAVRDCPVPTIAAVKGNCWGCGLEFVLNCRHRIAADTHCTNFRMTEVTDYLLFPTFDGVYNLPTQLGLENAAKLLLWGETWTSIKARNEFLVNEVADYRSFDGAVAQFVERVVAGEVPTCVPPRPTRGRWCDDDEAILQATREWTQALPSNYQRVYLDCLGEMERALKDGPLSDQNRAAARFFEVESVLSPAGKAAQSFFFIRQIANEISTGRAETPMHPRLAFAGPPGSFWEFATELQSRLVEGASVRLLAACPSNPDLECVLIDRSETNAEERAAPIDVEVRLHFQQLVSESARLHLYNPLWTLDRRIFELSAHDPSRHDCREVVSYLHQAGFIIVLTRMQGRAGIDRLLRAYFRPLVSCLKNGGRARDVNFTLRELGFVRRPHELLRDGIDFIAALLEPESSRGESGRRRDRCVVVADERGVRTRSKRPEARRRAHRFPSQVC